VPGQCIRLVENGNVPKRRLGPKRALERWGKEENLPVESEGSIEVPPSPHVALTLRSLRDPLLGEAWDHLLGLDELKESVVNSAILALELRRAGVPMAALPVHGLFLLCGPPGVGKSTLARGLAYQIGLRSARGPKEGYLVEINGHLLASDMLGRSQRAVQELFEDHLSKLAEQGLVVALLDEIEDVAVTRAGTSLAANPVDVHRTTNAMLAGLDHLAANSTNVLIVAATNFEESIDSALLSRADQVFHLSVPGADGVREIVLDTITALREVYPTLVPPTPSQLEQITTALTGRDGRTIRKLVFVALASCPATAADPSLFKGSDLVATAERLLRSRGDQGRNAYTETCVRS
jgi:pachytene checkpoint protein 2